MSADAIGVVLTDVIAAGVLLYLVWSNRHNHEESERKRDQQALLLEIQRGLDRTDNASLRRCLELQRKLDEHQRILKYLSRRLS
jgi:hypothetical protein